MESDIEHVEEVAPTARLRSPSPPLPFNVLQPEKDFILTFETLHELWDTTNPAYTNKYKRNENLAKLLPILKKIKPNATIDDVKKKINTIRSNHRRELKKIVNSKRSGAGADEIYIPKIWYFPCLHFLEKLEQPVPLQQTLHPTNQSQTTAETEQSTSQQSRQQSNTTTQERSFSSVSTIPKPSAPLSNKKKKTKHDELLDRACQFLAEPCSKTTESHKKTNPIALEWSDILDRLDPIQRLYAKKAINDILFEAELGNLSRDSVKINESHSYHSYTPSSRNFSFSLISPLHPPSPSSPQPDPVNSYHSYTPSQRNFSSSLMSLPPLPSPSSEQSDPVINTATSTLTSPPPPPSPAQQHIPLFSNQSNPQQHTGPVISTLPNNFTSLLRGTASQIILSSNYDRPPQTPALNSNEYILSSTHSQDNSNNIVSLFSQFTPEF